MHIFMEKKMEWVRVHRINKSYYQNLKEAMLSRGEGWARVHDGWLQQSYTRSKQ